jgi:hypothetical protein
MVETPRGHRGSTITNSEPVTLDKSDSYMPRQYSLKQVIAALRTHHGLISLAADALGCARSTLYLYMNTYPEVTAVVEEERERLVDMAEDGLYYHLQEKAPWAIAFTLKSLGRRRGYGERASTVSPDAAPEDPPDNIITIDVRSNGHHPV